MSETKPMKLWHICAGGETGWIAARYISSAAAIWAENVSDEDDEMTIEEVPVADVAGVMISNEDGHPQESMADAFAERVATDRPGYLCGSCR